MLMAQSDATGASQRLSEAVTIRRDLVKRNPDSSVYQRSLAITLQMIGTEYRYPGILNLGDTAAAQRNYREAMEIEERLARADPENEILKGDLAMTYRLLGLVMVPGDAAAAEELFNRTLATVASMKNGKTRADMRRENGNAHVGLAARRYFGGVTKKRFGRRTWR